ncbi:MAG: type II secretion system F family protein [Verrucomicrobiales bacterium]|nr:type II secretion system F family protein [Verrucomicrobiales bacterium]
MKDTKSAPPSSAAQAALKARIAEKNAPAKDAHHEPGKSSLFSKSEKTQKYPMKELIKLCRGMASMLKANINTADALRYYGSGHPSPLVRNTLSEVRDNIENGMTAYAAFEKTNRFDDKFVSLIRAGTDAGHLDKAFDSIAKRLKKENEFKAKMRKATLLPSIIIFALIMLFIAAQLNIIPQIEKMIKEVGQEPDTLSGILFKLSHITKKVWVLVVGSLLGAVFSFLFIENVRNNVTFFMMARWRLLRKLIMGMRQLLFLGSMDMLHSNGINLSKAVEISAKSLKGTPMYDELITAGKRYIETGLPFSEAIRKFTSCDAQVAHLISIGERSSSLDEQLKLLTTMYEEEVDQVVAEFSQVVNIIVLFSAALLITMVFIGAFLPIFLMGPKMMNGQGL